MTDKELVTILERTLEAIATDNITGIDNGVTGSMQEAYQTGYKCCALDLLMLIRKEFLNATNS